MPTLLDLPPELLRIIIRQCSEWDQTNIGLADRRLWDQARIVDETLYLYPDQEGISAALCLLSSHVADSIKNLELSLTDDRPTSSHYLRLAVKLVRMKDRTDHRGEPLDLCGELTRLFRECRNINRLTVQGAIPKPVLRLSSTPSWQRGQFRKKRQENQEREEEAAVLLSQIVRAAKEGSAEITSLFLTRVPVYELVAEADWQAQMNAGFSKLQHLAVQSFESGLASAQFLKKVMSFLSIQTLQIDGPSGLDNPVPFPNPGHDLAARKVKQLSLTNYSITMSTLKGVLDNFDVLEHVQLRGIRAIYPSEDGHDYRDIISHLEDRYAATFSRTQGSGGCNGKYTIEKISRET